MNLPYLLIAVSFIDLPVAVMAIYYLRVARQRTQDFEVLKEQAARANENYRKYRASLLEARDTLQLQLEGAEAAWGEADAAVKYKDHEITRLCELIKKDRIKMADIIVRYDHLRGQFNSLTKGTDEMPI